MIKILVTGASGQLARNLQDKVHAKNYTDKEFLFMSRKELSINDEKMLKDFFSSQKIDICINCAACTNVDQAESNTELAYVINTLGSRILASLCNLHGSLLIHISTDYVFDGQAQQPYKESDITRAINVYGDSKRAGELAIIEQIKCYFIVRTSWLFSKFGSNFIKTVYEHAKTKKSLKVVKDQYGSPTFADDLAEFLLFLVENQHSSYGIYHFSNQGVCSRYELAEALLSITSQTTTFLKPILRDVYHTGALRPPYSALDTTKVRETFKYNIPYWNKSLRHFVESLNFSEIF
ncbi:dTDP-4-dehydrorhamnose reductase [Bacteroidetes bacterium endosymbiont of Geopemphigus sp.]|uniref:dTDP-4-dehydrorhamnose reductase n=1 Tax=Bacteroidetes bacterium endosymbiont of Geopemphigus sp. TaxID=2047937 RepID=UPI000CCFF3E9|nr:dTDP-4-dehydrorhamnose reductase [Bacteroidetes bacterium endosymbiont of Geopemphigus sp.]